MLRADVVQAHIIPRSVSDVLDEATATGCSQGYSSTYAWCLHRQTLLLWKVEDALQASVRRLKLSERPSGRCFVEVIPHSSSAAVTVLLCTGSGQLFVWLDANFPADPYFQQLFVSANTATSEDAVICALAASPADGASSLGFLAVVATADAALHLYHGSQNGIFPRQFYTPNTAAGPKPGMFGALGSVVKALYSEAFDPLHNVQRSTASAMSALQLQLLQLDGNRWKLLVLTPEALDCWLLGTLAGQHSSEQLLWSYNLHGVLSGTLQARELTVLAFAASTVPHSHAVTAPAAVPTAQGRTPGRTPSVKTKRVCKQAVYVWSAHLGATSINQAHSLTALTLEEGSVVPTFLQSFNLEPSLALPQPQPGDRLSQWKMLPHTTYSSCLLLAPNGALLEWLPSEGAPTALGGSDENLGISISGQAPAGTAANWQLLNASYGMLEFVAQDPEAMGAAQALPGAMTPDQEAAATELIFKTVELMTKEYAAGCPYKDLADGLGDRLSRLGVFDAGQRGCELLVAASCSLVDTMAKAGSAGVSSGSLKALLSDKQIRHDLLLAAYQTGGILQRLSPQHARAVFEHSEKLAAVAAVLAWQRQQEASANAGDAAVTAAQTAAAAAVIEAAGAIASEGVDTTSSASSAGQQWEVFFSRPTASMPALFRAVAAQAATYKQDLAVDDRSGNALHAMQQLLGLAGLLQTAVAGAHSKAAELGTFMHDEVLHTAAAGASWLAGEKARAAWDQIAEASLQLHSCLLDSVQRLQLAHGAHLPALQQLLAGLRETIMCSSNPSPRLREDYARLPAEHGAVLLEDAKMELNGLRDTGVLFAAIEAAAAASMTDLTAADSDVAAVGHALIWPLEQLAQEHRCHELLFSVCDTLLLMGLHDRGRLLQHMQQEVSDAGGVLPEVCFTFFVMERWRSNGQLSLLLELGRKGFQQQLQQFLATYPELLWMSEVQAGMLDKAAGTLAAAADAEQGSVSQCRRLLCLSKLAARAAGSVAKQSRLQLKASARLRQLALQNDLHVLDQKPLSTAQLAQAALAVAQAGQGVAGAAAAVAAVEALALIPEQQQSEQYRHLWEQSWHAALQHTPLQELAATRAAARSAGGQPEQYDAAVRETALFVALQKAAAALADASKVQSGLSAQDVLDAAGAALVRQVQQQQPDALDCMQDLLTMAASAALPVLANA